MKTLLSTEEFVCQSQLVSTETPVAIIVCFKQIFQRFFIFNLEGNKFVVNCSNFAFTTSNLSNLDYVLLYHIPLESNFHIIFAATPCN